MIAWLIPIVGERYAKRVAIGLGVLAAVIMLAAGLWLWLHFHDRRVVANDRAAAAAEVGQRQVRAERAAGAAQASRDTEIRNDLAQQEERAHEARRNRSSALDDLHNGL
ncbi:hypothetical protein SAMN03159338_4286 [Sphingomonas sp. NFR04]|uniref:hypothetical protein n=1 Tax=Sphingomonas sp. NFR04 TaxID=1566283 RepID=UPI0008EEE36C|nr:hypothetical protein [Sphingomonas sp. NFR04]SFK44858.1 hypothetical protein SAMN03159338_4286 [Sphingomonas sp. NFR04]